jgi:transketolase
MVKWLNEDSSTVLLLGDIGVHAFRGAFKSHPERTINMGILEQATIGVAAGLSKIGFNPVVHTIAPFLVERPFEQLKVDFGYQRLRGNFVSVGSSIDYSALGCTHHCPGDVSLLLTIPGFEIYLPGTPTEFTNQFANNFRSNSASYFRLSEISNSRSILNTNLGAAKVKSGAKGTVISIGPTLDLVEEACIGLDVEIIYLNQIWPFNFEFIAQHCSSNSVVIVEPFYQGTTNHLVSEALRGRKFEIVNFGIPREFITSYGSRQDLFRAVGFTVRDLHNTIVGMIYG